VLLCAQPFLLYARSLSPSSNGSAPLKFLVFPRHPVAVSLGLSLDLSLQAKAK
jgi:hypothetical protein